MNVKLVFSALLIICLALATILLLPWSYSEDSDVNLKETEKNSRLGITASKNLVQNMTHYRAVIELPLFDPQRVVAKVKPTQLDNKIEQKKTVVFTPEPPRLLGVMMVKDSARAFVLGDGQPAVASLALGDSYQDWTLSDIGGNQVTMTYKDTNNVIISMNWFGKGIFQMDKDEGQLLPRSAQPLSNRQKNIIAESDLPKTLKDRLSRQVIDRL